MALKEMSLRYAGVCRVCSTSLPARTKAVYDTEAKNVVCLECRSSTTAPAPLPPPLPIDHGVAGAGPRAEYERRVAKREAELKAIPGLRGKIVRAFDTAPQSTTAWRQAPRVSVASRLRWRTASPRPPSRSVAARSRTREATLTTSSSHRRAWNVDSKNYAAQPEMRDIGTRRALCWRLYLYRRDRLKVVETFGWLVTALRAVLDPMGFGGATINPTVFLSERPIELRGVRVMWIRRLIELVNEPCPLGPDAMRAIATRPSAKLPAKGWRDEVSPGRGVR